MICGVSVVLLYLSSIIPTARLAVIAIAGLLPAAAVMRDRVSYGFLCYAATAILAFILIPAKDSAILYTAFFGLYPMIKILIEKLRRLPLEWLLKLAFFNAVLTVIMLFFSTLVFDFLQLDYAVYIIYTAGNIAFVVYDLGFTGLIALFLSRFGKMIMK